MWMFFGLQFDPFVRIQSRPYYTANFLMSSTNVEDVRVGSLFSAFWESDPAPINSQTRPLASLYLFSPKYFDL